MIQSTKEIALWTKKIAILPKMTSDHNPLMQYITKGRRQYNWRLNKDLLSHQKNVDLLKKEINEFFVTNMNNKVKIQNIQEAHKTVLTGNLMFMNGKDKKNQAKLQQLEVKIKGKETEFLKRPGTKSLIGEIEILQQVASFANEEICQNF